MNPRHSLILASTVVTVLFILGCGRKAPVVVPPPAKVVKKPPVIVPSPFIAPAHIRGIYLTAWSAGSTRKMAQVVAMMAKTELNSVVIDVRDAGQNYWKMPTIPLSAEIGANLIAIPNSEAAMKRVLDAKIYPIARIACFRDNYLPKKHPERAVNKITGGVWKDRGGYTWLDPYNLKNWEYLAKIVDFAMDQGFPEIQLDYVRFPSEGKSASQAFPAKKFYKDPKAKAEDVVSTFATYISKRVKARGRKISADIFGIISISKSAQGIGQELEKIAEPFDTISPMVYPSHFAKGEYGVKDPSASPYLIVFKSLTDYKRRLPNKNIRPWLQDFFGYGVADIQGQIRACKELGYEDYLLWNARNVYVADAVRDTSRFTPKSDATAEKVEPKAGVKPVVKPK